jgi:hypothetical protein
MGLLALKDDWDGKSSTNQCVCQSISATYSQ